MVVLAAIWVTVIAASAGRPAAGDNWVGLPDDKWFGLVLVGVLLSGPLFLLIAIIANRRKGEPPSHRQLPIWPALLVVLIMLALSQRNIDPPGEEAVEAEPVPASEAAEEPIQNPPARLGGTEFTVLVLMMAAAVAVLVWSSTRTSESTEIDIDPEEDQLEAVLIPALERAERHLLTATDPRSAVLLAYADLEVALTDAGHPPAHHETSSEYLRRVLQRLSVDAAPLYRLADLYQLARFSSHPITAGQQQAAATALDQVRGQLVPVR